MRNNISWALSGYIASLEAFVPLYSEYLDPDFRERSGTSSLLFSVLNLPSFTKKKKKCHVVRRKVRKKQKGKSRKEGSNNQAKQREQGKIKERTVKTN